MLMILSTPFLVIPPWRRLLPLPLQPSHQLPQEPFIPAILRRSSRQHCFFKAGNLMFGTCVCRRRHGSTCSRILVNGERTASKSTYGMPLYQCVRLLPSLAMSTPTFNIEGSHLTKQTNQPPTPLTRPYPPRPPTKISYHQALARY